METGADCLMSFMELMPSTGNLEQAGGDTQDFLTLILPMSNIKIRNGQNIYSCPLNLENVPTEFLFWSQAFLMLLAKGIL